MSEAVAEKAENAPAAASGGGNKKLLIIALAVNLLLAGGLGYVVLSNKSQAAGQAKAGKAKADEGHEDAEGEEGEAKEGEHEAAEDEDAKKDEKHAGAKFGPLVDIGTFVANLQGAPGQQPRYCKVGVYVEAKNEEAKASIEGAAVPIKAEALMMIANLRPEDVIGKERMTALSTELQKRANKLVGKNAVKRVFFSELVVQ